MLGANIYYCVLLVTFTSSMLVGKIDLKTLLIVSFTFELGWVSLLVKLLRKLKLQYSVLSESHNKGFEW